MLNAECWPLRKIGIYGGTFDPIHHAHLILARDALETLSLDEVRFVPANASPQKSQPCAPADLRLEMLRAAVADERGFAVDDLELRRPPPSFTFDTVTLIRERDPKAKLFLLIGEDNVAGLTTWHRFEDLRQLVRIVVLDRTGFESEHGYWTIRRRLDISATAIRKRVASGKSIRYLVPAAVEEIIRARGLYKERTTSRKKN